MSHGVKLDFSERGPGPDKAQVIAESGVIGIDWDGVKLGVPPTPVRFKSISIRATDLNPNDEVDWHPERQSHVRTAFFARVNTDVRTKISTERDFNKASQGPLSTMIH
jgi:hypothetical protein